jgi:tetratricopeptide (TPR) repeat protein
LLYELLTGTTPFESETLKKADYDEMRRILREDEPPKPSTRLSTMGQGALSTVCERRSADPRKLGQDVRGEPDWVVMKALEKDRDRRYESASALAADVQRYLNDEPVEACPPSAGYRLRKFTRRHRPTLVMASVIALALIATTVVSVWQTSVAQEALRQSEADRKQAEIDRDAAKDAQKTAKLAEGRAANEAAIAQAVNDFLQRDLLQQLDSGRDNWYTHDPNLTVRGALDRAAARIGSRFQDQPLVEAAIRTTIGDAYQGVGEGTLAAIQLERALALRREHLGPDHPATLDTMDRLAGPYGIVGRFLDAIALREEVLQRRQTSLGPDHDDTLNVMPKLIRNYHQAGQWDKALVLAQHVLKKREGVFGSNHFETLEGMCNVAWSYAGLGRLDEALTLYQAALNRYRANPDAQRSSSGQLLRSYAHACFMAGKLDEAERLTREGLDLSQRFQGINERANRAQAMSNLAVILLKQERFAEAELIARQAQELFETTPIVHSGPNNVRTFHAISLVGGALLGQKRYAEAEPFLLKGYEGIKQREALIAHENLTWIWPKDALRRIIQLYEETNQAEKAHQWREKLQKDKQQK